MTILYFYQYFSTPKGSWGTRAYEFSRQWIKKGHKVVVVTSVYAKSDLSTNRLLETQIIDGIIVKIINIKINNKQPLFLRLITFFSYAFISIWYSLTIKADVVIASSGPITVGLPGLFAKYFRSIPLVFEVRDLWPDGAIDLGIIRNKFLKKIAYWFEYKCYKNSSLIVSLSPGIKDFIINKYNLPNVISVTNSANIELFNTKQCQPNNLFPIKKYAIYTGNIGEVNNSKLLLDISVELCKLGRSDLKIVLIGDGPMRNELVLKARDLPNFIVLGLMSKVDLVPFIQNALVSLVPLKNSLILDTSSPNKLFESLAAGVPVIQTSSGWIKDFLDFHQVGYTIQSDFPKLFAEKIIDLDINSSSTNSMSDRCFLVAEQYFNKDYLAEKMLKEIEQIV